VACEEPDPELTVVELSPYWLLYALESELDPESEVESEVVVAEVPDPELSVLAALEEPECVTAAPRKPASPSDPAIDPATMPRRTRVIRASCSARLSRLLMTRECAPFL
jgi:hypothetical protein